VSVVAFQDVLAVTAQVVVEEIGDHASAIDHRHQRVGRAVDAAKVGLLAADTAVDGLAKHHPG
jgi:hypothetical protein